MVENLKHMVEEEVLSRNDEIVDSAMSEYNKFKNFKIVWSNDENLTSINSLTYEELWKYNLLGYANKFENYCYRLKQ